MAIIPRERIDADMVLRRLVPWAEARADVRAALITSTRAAAAAAVDAWSDHDVILAVSDVGPFFEDRLWLEDFGTVLVVYRDPIRIQHGLPRFAYITQYENGTKIDFTLMAAGILRQIAVEPALPDELDVGYAVLLDKDGLTAGLAEPTYRAHIPARPTRAAYLTLIEEFFHEATYVAKHLARADLLPAKYNLDYAMKQLMLRRMLEWRIETDHAWSLKPGAYGKGLRKHLSPAVWAELEATYVGPGREENWDALLRTIGLFRKVASEVGEALGYDYPADLDRRSVAYLRRVQAKETPCA